MTIRKKITTVVVKNATEAFTWDTEIVGLALKVDQATGAKSFVYQYRTPHGRSRRPTLGKARDLTADEARSKAKKWRRIVEDGGDPLGAKQEQRTALTGSGLFDLYLASEAFAAKADSTKAIDRGRIDRHLRPTLGRKFVGGAGFTPEDVRGAFTKIRDGKTAAVVKTKKFGLARVTGGEGTARMAVRLLRAIERWALREKLIVTSGATDVDVGSDGERDTILETGEDYGRLFRTLDTMETEKRIRSPHADAIRVIALTGARRGEVTRLRWRHVDLAAGLITLPAPEHKTGRKTKKPRVIGLPTTAQAIISRQPSGEPDEYVFVAAKGEGPITLSSVWRKVRVEAKLPEDIGLHGLRHSLATSMAVGGAQASEIMTALGHRQITTSQKYVHWAKDARVALAERAAAGISAAMAQKPKGTVVAMKARRK